MVIGSSWVLLLQGCVSGRIRVDVQKKTFNWLFEELQSIGNANGVRSLISMLDWLRTHNGLFCISDKAGSGQFDAYEGIFITTGRLWQHFMRGRICKSLSRTF